MTSLMAGFVLSSLVLALVLVGGVAIWAWCVRSHMLAIRRSEALLQQHLTSSELEHLNRTGTLRVQSPVTPGRVYAVPISGFVTVLENNDMVMRLCIHPRAVLAGRESVLAHKMHIEAAEDEYVRQAVVVWRVGAARSSMI